MKLNLLFVLFICFGITNAQNKKYNAKDISVSPFIDGTIIIPEASEKIPLVILIGDSGPTDRNGNQQMMENNSLRYLSEELFENGIASFRYDKRIVKQMKTKNINEKDIRFDDFIKDAIGVIDFFKKGNAFSEIIIIGHGQGSLIGMIAAQNRADKFISIGGAGQEIDNVIVDQLEQQAPGLRANAIEAFTELRENGSTQNYSTGLASIFRPAIQPFIRSWMLYNPKAELAKLDIPVLIINGDKDLQVQISEAELLRKAKPGAQFEIIAEMNHIFKEFKGNDMENSKSYNEYKTPVIPRLVEIISTFINQ